MVVAGLVAGLAAAAVVSACSSRVEGSHPPLLQAELAPEGPSAPQRQPVLAGRTASIVGSSSPIDVLPTGDGSDLDRDGLERLLAARYRGFWSEFDAARRTPGLDPAAEFPGLADLAAGEQLDVSHRNLTDLARSGEALRQPGVGVHPDDRSHLVHRVRVESIDGTVARLTGCVVKDDVRYVIASGLVVADSVSTVLSESTMALTDGEWKLIRSRAVDIVAGISGCWLSAEAQFPL